MLEKERDISSAETGKTKEISLFGKTALITGGSRDIGAEITLALAQKGVNPIVVFREKQRRANEMQEVIKGVDDGIKSSFVQADITVEQDRLKLREELLKSFDGRLDFLVLCASGKTEDINVTANNALADLLLPFMPKGGTIVFMQSVPGHFQEEYPDLVPDFYKETAKAKHAGEKSLVSRIGEFKEKGINFIVVCPPEVPDTSNMKLFSRIDPEVSEKHAIFSRMLGIPEKVNKKEVGEKVAELLCRPDLQTGHLELFKTNAL